MCGASGGRAGPQVPKSQNKKVISVKVDRDKEGGRVNKEQEKEQEVLEIIKISFA